MKLSVNLSLLASAAFLALPATAFPNLANLLAPGPNGGASHFEKRVLAADPDQLQNLLNVIGSTVTKLDAQVNVPDASALLSMKIVDITPQKIYDTFGVRRDGGLLPPAEDADHLWQPRPAGAKRGPCPGLNTLANHGYLPRNGVVDPAELLIGTFNGLNLSPDLAAVLAAISFVGVGDLTQLKLSIGDQYGLGSGLNHHGILEGDGSITRKDHYFGNSWDADPDLVTQFINETNTFGHGNVDIFSLANSRYRAWDHSRQNNPEFDFNPWRMLVAYAESGFVHELLRGSSVKFDEDMIKSWFLNERFPQGWSKRIVPFSVPEILAWAGIIEVVKPTVTGWSFGKGMFVPIPTTDGWHELKSLYNPNSATLSALACDAGKGALSWFPSQVINLIGNFGVKGINTSPNCNW